MARLAAWRLHQHATPTRLVFVPPREKRIISDSIKSWRPHGLKTHVLIAPSWGGTEAREDEHDRAHWDGAGEATEEKGGEHRRNVRRSTCSCLRPLIRHFPRCERRVAPSSLEETFSPMASTSGMCPWHREISAWERDWQTRTRSQRERTAFPTPPRERRHEGNSPCKRNWGR